MSIDTNTNTARQLMNRISPDEIAGQYFAGVYCKECWERERHDI